MGKKLKYIIKRIKEEFTNNPIKDEIRYLSKQLKKDKKYTNSLKIEIKETKDKLFFLIGQLEEIQKENDLIIAWKDTLVNKLKDV